MDGRIRAVDVAKVSRSAKPRVGVRQGRVELNVTGNGDGVTRAAVPRRKLQGGTLGRSHPDVWVGDAQALLLRLLPHLHDSKPAACKTGAVSELGAPRVNERGQPACVIHVPRIGLPCADDKGKAEEMPS